MHLLNFTLAARHICRQEQGQDGMEHGGTAQYLHLQTAGSEGLHHPSDIKNELLQVLANVTTVKDKGVRHGAILLLRPLLGSCPLFFLVLRLWGQRGSGNCVRNGTLKVTRKLVPPPPNPLFQSRVLPCSASSNGNTTS